MVVVVVSVSGCSLLLPTVGDKHRPGDATECSDNTTLPVADTALATAGGVIAMAAILEDCTDPPPYEDVDDVCKALMPFVALGTATVAVLYAFSARRGFRQVRKCRQARKDYRGQPGLDLRRATKAQP